MKRLCILLLIVLAIGPAHAGDMPLVQVMQTLARVRSSDATFSEAKTMAMLDAPIVSTGTLAYRAPGHVERITVSPKPETLVVDGDSLTITQDGTTRQVGLSDIPAVGALVEAVRATLAGDLPALQKHFTVTLQGDQAHWVLLLQPTEPAVQRLVQYVRITGDGAAMRGIETLEANGDSSVMTIRPVKQ
jgi:outer membrane lipoprotein-sorting protein